jgi:hypothetical protein
VKRYRSLLRTRTCVSRQWNHAERDQQYWGKKKKKVIVSQMERRCVGLRKPTCEDKNMSVRVSQPLETWIWKTSYACFPFCSRAIFRVARSPSANHLLALTSCTTLMNCLRAMTGAEMPVITHGQKLSSLFARANSSAPALQGLANRVVGAG